MKDSETLRGRVTAHGICQTSGALDTGYEIVTSVRQKGVLFLGRPKIRKNPNFRFETHKNVGDNFYFVYK